MTDKKKTEELSEKELDEVQGAGTKGLVGDDVGILRGGKGEPDKFDETTGDGPNTF